MCWKRMHAASRFPVLQKTGSRRRLCQRRAQCAAHRHLSQPHHPDHRRVAGQTRHRQQSTPSIRCRRIWAAGTGTPRTSRCGPCGTRCMTAAARSPACPGRSASAPASIDFNLPEYWRADMPEDLKLVRALSTPGLVPCWKRPPGLTLAQADGESVEVDVGRARFAAALIAAKHPAVHHRASARAGSYRAWSRPRLAGSDGRAGNTG